MTQTDHHPQTSEGRAIAALVLLGLLFFLVTAGSFTALGAVLPDMVTTLHWDWEGAGLGYTILGLSCGLASFVPALLIPRVGVRLTLMLGAATMAAGFACFATLTALPLYWLGAALLGVGFALATVVPASFVIARSFSRRASLAFGVYFTLGGLGGACGPLFYAGLKAIGAGWRGYWTLAALALLVCGASAALVVPKSRRDDLNPDLDATSGDFSVRHALATPQFWIVTFAYSVSLICETSVNGLSVAHLIHQGIAPAAAAGMLSLQALLTTAGRAGAGGLGERVDPRLITAAALALMAVGIGALTLAHGYPLMLTYAVGVGVGYGVSSLTALVLILRYFGRRANLELVSIMLLVSTVASGGPWLAGWMRDRFGGFEGAFALFGVLTAAGFVAMLLTSAPKRSGSSQTKAMADSSRP
jgi:cyanate permease